MKSWQDEELKSNDDEEESLFSLKEKKKNRKSEVALRRKSDDGKYLVNGRYLNLDEVNELATKAPSEEQLKEDSERLEYSSKLIDLIKADELKVIIF